MPRTILAIVLGWALVVVLALATDWALLRLFPAEYVRGRMPPDRLAALSLVTSAVWSSAAGWLCCFLARCRTWRPALALAVTGEVMIASSAILAWGRIQPWYPITLLVAWPAFALLGAALERRRLVRQSGR